MIILPRDVAVRDIRGTITDILRNTPVENVVVLTTKAGGVRGNHYHLHATVHCYLLSGEMEVYSRTAKDAKVTQAVLHAGEIVTFLPYDLHALVALEDSTLLLLAHGPRGGDLTVREDLV